MTCTLSFALHGVALAHGEPPEIVGIASADGQGPNVLLLNEGLAYRDGAHFTYVCPSLWGDTDIREFGSPHAHGDGITTWIVGLDAVYMLQGDALMPLSRAPIASASAFSYPIWPDARAAMVSASVAWLDCMITVARTPSVWKSRND